MTKQTSIMLAMATAALVAASRATAANPSNLSYTDNDLLLDFRNSVQDSGSDATFDVGNVNTFLSAVGALTGSTSVLDSGTGYGTSTYPVQFSGTTLISKVSQDGSGTADDIGFSSAAENLAASGANGDTVWVTRQIFAAQLTTGGTANIQQGATAQVGTANAIQQIGLGAEPASSGGAGTQFVGALNGGIVADGNGGSYHSNAEDGNNVDLIDYGSSQNPSNPSAMEATPVAGTVYEALWEVPQTGNGADTYEGYFTFKQDGELDFTKPPAAVPEPSTYGLLAGAGLVAVALRRQRRAQAA